MSSIIDVEKVLLQELREDTPDYVFIKDRESRFVFTNKAHAQHLLGLENPTDAVGKTDFDLFPGKEKDAQRFYDEEQSIMETGQPVLHREWMVPSTSTREIVWLSENKLPIRNEAGEIIGLFGLGRDITERKQAQLLAEKLSHQLETGVQVTRIASGILEPRELTQQIVNLVHERFDFYYVGLFLVDQVQRLNSNPGEYAVLQAATGDAGQKLLAQNYKVKANQDSLVGQCIVTGKPCITQITQLGKRAEMALPLVSRQEIMGALHIQSTAESAFTEQDLSVFEVLASLLATSLQNAFLFQKLDEELKATKSDLQNYVRSGWDKYLGKK